MFSKNSGKFLIKIRARRPVRYFQPHAEYEQEAAEQTKDLRD